MAKPAHCAKIPALLTRKKSASPWTIGRFASMISIRRMSPGRPLNRFRRCSASNYAAYDRNKSHGVPCDGAALLHGMVYCGE